MKEIFCVILQGFLTQKETVYVQADDIVLDDTGVRLYDAERCVAYFSNEIFRGVYRRLDECIQEIPKEEMRKMTREEEENVIKVLKTMPTKNMAAMVLQSIIQEKGFFSKEAGDEIRKIIEEIEK